MRTLFRGYYVTYRLWIGEIDGGAAEDHYAFDWLKNMQERGYDNVRIEPAPGAQITFPLNDDNSEEVTLPPVIAMARCPYCHEPVAVPGFDQLWAFVCPHCGQGAQIELPIE